MPSAYDKLVLVLVRFVKEPFVKLLSKGQSSAIQLWKKYQYYVRTIHFRISLLCSIIVFICCCCFLDITMIIGLDSSAFFRIAEGWGRN